MKAMMLIRKLGYYASKPIPTPANDVTTFGNIGSLASKIVENVQISMKLQLQQLNAELASDDLDPVTRDEIAQEYASLKLRVEGPKLHLANA